MVSERLWEEYYNKYHIDTEEIEDRCKGLLRIIRGRHRYWKVVVLECRKCKKCLGIIYHRTCYLDYRDLATIHNISFCKHFKSDLYPASIKDNPILFSDIKRKAIYYFPLPTQIYILSKNN